MSTWPGATMWLISYVVMTKAPGEPGGGLPRNAVTALHPVEWLASMGRAAADNMLGESAFVVAVWITGALAFDPAHRPDWAIADIACFDDILLPQLVKASDQAVAPP